MSLPKEPRQKMINIMYLVLTALLALNVSSEILNAFKTIDLSLSKSNNQIQEGNDGIISSLKELSKDPKTAADASIWLPKAIKATEVADAVYMEIESLKLELKKGSGLKTEGSEEKYSEDNLEAATRILVEGGKGKELYSHLENFKKELSDLDPEIAKEVIPKLPLNLEIPRGEGNVVYKDWSYAYFNMTPTIAAITILTKFQNDIRNCEAQVVTYCHSKVGAVKIPITSFFAIAGLNSEYVNQGDDIILKAGLGAYSEAAKPNINIDGVNVPLGNDGTAEYRLKATNLGPNSKHVRISYLDPKTGKPAIVEKDLKFNVGTSSGLAVSFDKTRVFYKGQPNLLTINGGGNAKNIKVELSGSGATAKSVADGQFIVSCPQVGRTLLTVTDGKSVYKKEIEIKRVPDPTVTVGKKEGGNMRANEFKAQYGVYAQLGDFFFEGVKFDVLSYTILFTGKGFPKPTLRDVNGANFDSSTKELIKLCEPGTNVTIGNIKLSEPGGGSRFIEKQISLILD